MSITPPAPSDMLIAPTLLLFARAPLAMLSVPLPEKVVTPGGTVSAKPSAPLKARESTAPEAME